MLYFIKNWFTCLTKEIFVPLYSAFVRPHLEYASQPNCPYLKKDIYYLEIIQRAATRWVKGLRDLNYEDGLKELKLPLAVASVQDQLAFKRQLDTYIYPYILLLSLFSPQYGLFWAICPFLIIKYIHTKKPINILSTQPYTPFFSTTTWWRTVVIGLEIFEKRHLFRHSLDISLPFTWHRSHICSAKIDMIFNNTYTRVLLLSKKPGSHSVF